MESNHDIILCSFLGLPEILSSMLEAQKSGSLSTATSPDRVALMPKRVRPRSLSLPFVRSRIENEQGTYGICLYSATKGECQLLAPDRVRIHVRDGGYFPPLAFPQGIFYDARYSPITFRGCHRVLRFSPGTGFRLPRTYRAFA